MKKQKRIKINHGTARVDEDCSQETINMLNALADAAYNMDFTKIEKASMKGNNTNSPYPKKTT